MMAVCSEFSVQVKDYEVFTIDQMYNYMNALYMKSEVLKKQ